MEIEDILYRITLIAFTIMSLVAVLSIKAIYKDPKRFSKVPPAWWPYEKKGWLIWARATPILTPFAPIGAIAANLLEYGDVTIPIVRTFFLVFAFTLLVGVPLCVLVALAGRPKWIIPPHLRYARQLNIVHQRRQHSSRFSRHPC